MEKTRIRELIENSPEKEISSAWNHVCDSTGGIYVELNCDTILDEIISSPSRALLAANSGLYKYTDSFVFVDYAGNLNSFNYHDDMNSPIDVEAMSEYFSRHEDELEYCFSSYEEFEREEEELDL